MRNKNKLLLISKALDKIYKQMHKAWRWITKNAAVILI